MKFVAGYLVVYGIALAVLAKLSPFASRKEMGLAVGEWLLILVVMGGVFSGIAWLLTLKQTPLPTQTGPVKWILLYLIVVAGYIAGSYAILPKGQPWQDGAVLAGKLIVLVVIPWLLFDRRFPPFEMGARDWLTTIVMSALLFRFQQVFGRGLLEISNAHFTRNEMLAAMTFTFVWLAIEAGLVEEYFFRVLLQTRLETLTRSSGGGIVLAALFFGLIHLPGLFLRPESTGEGFHSAPSFLFALCFSIVVLSPAGLYLGVLWARTRNIVVVIIVHAMTDLVPNVVVLAQHFGLKHSGG